MPDQPRRRSESRRGKAFRIWKVFASRFHLPVRHGRTPGHHCAAGEHVRAACWREGNGRDRSRIQECYFGKAAR